MRKVVILVYAGSNPATWTKTFTNDERSLSMNKKGGLVMRDETHIEITEDEMWVNGSKARIDPETLFIENDDEVTKPLRVTVTILPDSLTVRRGQKEPEPKISPDPIILNATTALYVTEVPDDG